MTETIYAVLFTPCEYESEYGLVSIHKTKDGAEEKVKIEKKKKKRKLEEWEHYLVREIEVQP